MDILNNQEHYYTPTINDLKEGFKFELQVYDYDTDEYIDEWEEHVFDVRSGLSHDEYHTFTEGRVKALIPEINNKPKPMSTTKSLGEQRVRTDFNVSGDSYIDQLKQAGSNFIDLINSAPIQDNLEEKGIHTSEFYRLKALAMTAIEEGTMWSVKMATL